MDNDKKELKLLKSLPFYLSWKDERVKIGVWLPRHLDESMNHCFLALNSLYYIPNPKCSFTLAIVFSEMTFALSAPSFNIFINSSEFLIA